jgi:alanyl-tRNA synthetase
LNTAEIRKAFLRYFEERSHQVVASDSLIPSTDPSLLFTSAGMVQFKPNFQNPEASPFKRATSCQKCLRTSDIERVGLTLRHLTFFEMLGNFSFGDYFKKDAIAWGWEFLTKELGLPKDRFLVSVFRDDQEAFDLWSAIVPKEPIIRLGEDSNFWTMGPTGPCGPCSEIIWDRGASWGGLKADGTPDYDSDRYLEVWNLVFTQFDRQADGSLKPLPRKNIDTGMGLERLSLVSQGVNSPFGTDAFQSVYRKLADLSHREIPKDPENTLPPPADVAAFRRIADHARAVTFMICDGILPSNEGRGYVLRRLLRQAVRAGKTLGIRDSFVHQLTGTVVETMKGAYPETLQRRETIASVVKIEEEKFLETLDTGTRQFEEILSSVKAQKKSVLPGKEVFQLYDTFGFPFELTKEMAEAQGFQVDAEGFKKAQEQAVELARQAWKGSGAQDVDHYHQWKAKSSGTSLFKGYAALELPSRILKPLFRRGESGWMEVSELAAGEEGELVCPETPFYPEGGGQVGDAGAIKSASGVADVLDTQSPVDGLIVHRVKVTRGTLSAGEDVVLRVDPAKRQATMRHHTATHMLHKALREVLGSHVTQAGSLVAPDRLRFDFNHHAPLSREERQRVEDIVNEQILNDIPVHACKMTKDQAHDVGAMMLFGEKYGTDVRAIMVSQDDCSKAKEAWSLELCGGTHVHATGQIGVFKILSQSAVSAGVRRIEAVAGLSAMEAIRKMEYQLVTAAETLKTTPEDLLPKIERVLAQEKLLERQIESFKSSALRSQFTDIATTAISVGGITVIRHRLEGAEDKQLREVADRLKDSADAGVVVLAAATQDKVSFVVTVQKNLTERGVHAGQIAREFAALIQGSGGGRPDFAQGGGKNPQELDRALAHVEDIIKKLSIKSGHKN